MKQTLLSNWNFMRLLRLGMGIAILVQGIILKDVLLAFAGIIFTAMPVFNVGCCGAAGCATPLKKGQDTTKEIGYEEVV